MIELDQLKYSLNSYREPLEKLSGSLGLEEKKERIEQLELDMEAPGFWEDLEESQKVVREVKGLKDQVEGYEGLKGQFEDIETLIEMASEEEDEELAGSEITLSSSNPMMAFCAAFPAFSVFAARSFCASADFDSPERGI